MIFPGKNHKTTVLTFFPAPFHWHRDGTPSESIRRMPLPIADPHLKIPESTQPVSDMPPPCSGRMSPPDPRQAWPVSP